MNDTVIQVRELRKRYGTMTAVDGISFDIRRGETFALLGPNGAGKSTTIEILEGYRNRTSGDVGVLGVDPRRAGLDWKARLGIVLQTSGEAGTVTVRELLTEFAGYYPHPRPVDEVIAAVGLEAKQKVRVSRLSGGQKRRLDVALGIIGRPELLFLDEPTTGFDPEARRQFWELIHSLKAEGTSILLTTHYLDEAAQLGDRAAVITGGRIAALGAIDEIGGSEARIPVVRWTDTTGLAHARRTSEPGALVAALFRDGGEPSGLEVVRPTLEDIYLGLIRDTEEHDSSEEASAAGSSPADPHVHPSLTAVSEEV
ncbi:ABC transporter ATP-binding protein [Microbacterium sp. CIAB417]|uniref:ABC transporter ATP-binding protein n=1 Tax=Microbacterium sp. CIAB417 TaxID=2860287 RepID=UPI001FADD0FE|nr:ABC transporter ATP-binding protein [Microbacterium sp. CIAB417]